MREAVYRVPCVQCTAVLCTVYYVRVQPGTDTVQDLSAGTPLYMFIDSTVQELAFLEALDCGRRRKFPMTSRLDTSPQVRLRLLARNLDLAERDADEALSRADGDVLSAEQMLRNLTLRTRQVVRPGSCTTLTRDQRIRKCASALACTPDALELLHASLNKVYEQPHNERLRKVNVTTGIFHARVAANNPAGVELLYAVGYEPMHGHLVLQKHDPTVLAVALQELGAAKHLPAYIVAITARADDRARREETAREAAAKAMLRASYLAKVPAEPSEADAVNHASSACVITVGVANGDAPAGNAPRVATRRFDSDCTLEDLVNYVRSLPAVTTPDGELTIANVTTRPTRVLDAAAESHASLYALDLWPRGRIEVRVGV